MIRLLRKNTLLPFIFLMFQFFTTSPMDGPDVPPWLFTYMCRALLNGAHPNDGRNETDPQRPIVQLLRTKRDNVRLRDLVRLLLKYNVGMNENPPSWLLERYVSDGRTQTRTRLSTSIIANHTTRSLIHEAAARGMHRMTAFLLAQGGNVNAATGYGKTPLCLALEKLLRLPYEVQEDHPVRRYGFRARYCATIATLVNAGGQILLFDNSLRRGAPWDNLIIVTPDVDLPDGGWGVGAYNRLFDEWDDAPPVPSLRHLCALKIDEEGFRNQLSPPVVPHRPRTLFYLCMRRLARSTAPGEVLELFGIGHRIEEYEQVPIF